MWEIDRRLVIGARPPAMASDSSQPFCEVSTGLYARVCCGAINQPSKAHAVYSQRLSSPFLDLPLVLIAFHPAHPVLARTTLPTVTTEQGYKTRVRVSARLRPLRLLTLFVCYATMRSRMRPKPRCLSSRYSPATPQYECFYVIYPVPHRLLLLADFLQCD